MSEVTWRTGVGWGLLLIALLIAGEEAPCDAQWNNYAQSGEPDEEGIALLQATPHDIVRFTPEAGGGWAKVLLLDLPGRQIPSAPRGELAMQVLGLEGQAFAAKWSDIASIDLWEERIERETAERIKAGDFTGAYPYLAILIRDVPNRPGLKTLRSEYLLGNAAKRFRDGELEPTLAMLEELRRFNPDYRTAAVLGVISRVTDAIMTRMVENRQFDDAQKLLARLIADYPSGDVDSIQKWDRQFLAMAEAKQEEAVAAKELEDFRTARRAALESLYLYPEIPGGAALVREIDAIYPLVRVGVLQSAGDLDPTRIDNWASRRAGRLVYRTLFEMRGTGPEGGEYDFVLGDAEQSPDRLTLDLTFLPQKMRPPFDNLDSQTIADWFALRASPRSDHYVAPWAAILDSTTLRGPRQISCLLRRPHVLPVSLLQIPIHGEMVGLSPGEPTGVYRLVTEDAVTPGEQRFKLVGDPVTVSQPREIVEIKIATSANGVSGLLRGELDIVDHLFPADAARLRRSRNVVVADFPLPTVHMLVPCSDHPFLAEPAFRRALVYGTNREDILQGELLENQPFPGCRVISGPFPAGVVSNDPLAYAYDETIVPRSYQPQVASLLIVLTQKQMEAAATRKKETPPKLTPIRLAVPDDDLSQIACQAIKSQWELIQVPVEIVSLPSGVTRPEPGTADLVYTTAAVWEPTIDARRVLGPDGLAKSQNQMIGLGLRQLESANTWKDVREKLFELHFIANQELPIIPLWQVVDSFAYRRDLSGIGSDIVSLYQNVERWRLNQ